MTISMIMYTDGRNSMRILLMDIQQLHTDVASSIRTGHVLQAASDNQVAQGAQVLNTPRYSWVGAGGIATAASLAARPLFLQIPMLDMCTASASQIFSSAGDRSYEM